MISSVLPPSHPSSTLPAPPPPSLAELRAAARERLDAAEDPVLPAVPVERPAPLQPLRWTPTADPSPTSSKIRGIR